MKKYRVGIIGFAHPHINHVATLFTAHPQVEWVAVADTHPLKPEMRVAPYTREWNRDNVIKQAGIKKRYDHYLDMLKQEKFDLILVQSENSQHPDVVEACARAGINVCVEKPMAMSLSHALRMERACRAANTTLAVNWPVTWLPHARKAKELLESNIIGRVLEVDYRASHAGPFGAGAEHKAGGQPNAPLNGEERGATWLHQKAPGGGAFLDLCCYGVTYSYWYTGELATSVAGLKANLNSPWAEAEDNGAMIIRYPRAIAMAQGSWTTIAKSFLSVGPLMIYGETGMMSFEIYGEKPVVRVVHGPDHKVEMIEASPLPKGRANLAEELIHHFETGDPLHETLTARFNVNTSAIMDAGIRSAQSGSFENVNDPAKCTCAGM